MIDRGKAIVINRCRSLQCRRVYAMVPGAQWLIEVLETGSDTCDHVIEPGDAVRIPRDVLIIHALWTAGRHAVPAGMDPRAHVLADTLGYQPGEAVPLSEIPLQLVDIAAMQLTWQGMCTAYRVARVTRDRWNATGQHVARWSAITEYLGRWQHHVL